MNSVELKINQEKEVYVMPDIQIIEIEVEKGFAQSGGNESGNPGGEEEGGF